MNTHKSQREIFKGKKAITFNFLWKWEIKGGTVALVILRGNLLNKDFNWHQIFTIYMGRSTTKTKQVSKSFEGEKKEQERKRRLYITYKKGREQMEWRKWYLDAVLVPCALLMMFCYHIYLWFKVRAEPFSTIVGINARARRSWVAAIMKV